MSLVSLLWTLTSFLPGNVVQAEFEVFDIRVGC